MILLMVEETAARHGKFDGWVDGKKIVASSREPFFDAARALLAKGVDSSLMLQMRHRDTGTDSLRATVGQAAKWTVEESPVRGPRMRRWRPTPYAARDDE